MPHRADAHRRAVLAAMMFEARGSQATAQYLLRAAEAEPPDLQTIVDRLQARLDDPLGSQVIPLPCRVAGPRTSQGGG